MTTSSLDWNSPLTQLFSSKKSKTLEKLEIAEKYSLKDILWIFPLRVEKIPPLDSFKNLSNHGFFRGFAKVMTVQSTPNFKSRGKGKAMLSNCTLTVQDSLSSETISLKFFNVYPSQSSSLSQLKYISFTGKVSSYMGTFQIVNPDYQESSLELFKNQDPSIYGKEELLIYYPTYQKISPGHLKAVFNKIPLSLWKSIPEKLPKNYLEKRKMLSLGESFRILHGKTQALNWNEDLCARARNRLIYEEFFIEQLRIKSRRELNIINPGIKHKVSKILIKEIYEKFPYELTKDQKKVIEEIQNDLLGKKQMMRLVQGDVGSGKTSVALAAGIISIKNGFQTALMCPTESLALQHYHGLQKILTSFSIKVSIITGSTKNKEKNNILEKIENGTTSFIIGTHSLIQESVKFNNLSLAIIDEQHKFGVDQRLKLVNKNQGVHCLLLTATPIPRSLSLTQYGDLDVSLIKSMPKNRKGVKTRIVPPENFEKFLSFLNTRLSMNEQAYIVVPAIVDNENQDIFNLEEVLLKFRNLFSKYRITGLHGQLRPEEKAEAFLDFKNHKIDLLISTSVIEVGINVLNATVIAILNPERFGLSSLHQLRGRVGRGEKPGFCFLINDKKISSSSNQRLKVIEGTIDGFKIAEEDLKNRGEGDLFGTDQSGITQTRILANLITHQEALYAAKEDVESLYQSKEPFILDILNKFKSDSRTIQTI